MHYTNKYSMLYFEPLANLVVCNCTLTHSVCIWANLAWALSGSCRIWVGLATDCWLRLPHESHTGLFPPKGAGLNSLCWSITGGWGIKVKLVSHMLPLISLSFLLSVSPRTVKEHNSISTIKQLSHSQCASLGKSCYSGHHSINYSFIHPFIHSSSHLLSTHQTSI